jgi:hypothetical protein
MSAPTQEMPTYEDHESALIEIAFLLDIFATTIDDLMGGATASINRISGRSMAQKLPVYLKNPSLQETINAVASEFKGGFEISSCSGERCTDLTVGKCAIRSICQARNIPLNGSLCRLFHNYLDGVIGDLHSRPVKSVIVTADKTCRARLESK